MLWKWLASILGSAVALSFRTTPLEMTTMSASSQFGKGLILSVFQSLMLHKSLESFVRLISIPTLPLGDYLLSSVGKDDGYNLAAIFMDRHQFSDKLNIDLISRVYWSRLLLSRQELPVLTETVLGHDNIWKLEEEFLMDVDQLTSKTFCATIEEDWITGDSLWAFVDGECLAGAQPYSLHSFVFNLLYIEAGFINNNFNGLLPLIKYQQLLVALAYLETLETPSHRLLINRIQSIAKEIINTLKDYRFNDIQIDGNELFDLTLTITARTLAHPAFKSKSSSWVTYFERVWTELQGLKDRKLIGVIKHRAMINCLCLAISMGLAEEFEATEKVQKILESPRHLVPNRDLYTLLIMMQSHEEVSLSLASTLVFWTLASRNSSAFSIMKVNSAHFGLLEGLSDNQSSMEAFRYHLWSSAQAHGDLRLLRSMDIEFALADILNNHFVAYNREFTKTALLVPRLEIHPFVENRLSSLLRLAVMLRIRLDVKIHPLYFKLLFGQGSTHETNKPEIVRKLVRNIIARQFQNSWLNDLSINASLRQFDTLHSECTAHKSIRGETSADYSEFLLESSRKMGFLENIWRIDGRHVAMQTILERMAVQVWNTKYRTGAIKLDLGHMDLVGDPQYLFFGT